MKAIVRERYGPPDVLELRDVPDPTVADGAALVRVKAASANPADWHLLRGDPSIARLSFGLRTPKDPVLGCDLAGRVEAVGAGTVLSPGDDVYACTFMHGFGAFAEKACVAADLLVPKPANLTFEEAAAVPIAAVTALQGLRDHGRVEAGQRALIVGGSGGVGTFAIQIAKHLGAEVTAVCSGRNAELVTSLGAERVIDYTREDFTRSGPYDVILQLAGTASPSECRRALTRDGTLLLSSGEPRGRVFGPLGRAVKARLLSPFVGQRMLSFTMEASGEDLRAITELIENGTVRPVIDRTYPLSDVPAAIGYLEQGHARGKVAITVSG